MTTNIKTHDYQRGDKIEVKDRGEWKPAKVVDANSPRCIIAHIEGYDTALRFRVDDPTIRPRKE